MKLNGILAKRLGPLSLGGWIGICIAIAAAGVIRSYVWPEKMNGHYLQELIETGTIQKTATAYVATIKKANTAPTPTETEWVQIEKGLSDCMVKEANKFLASDDPYLRVKADKTTPPFLAKRFLEACGATESDAPAVSSHSAKGGWKDAPIVVPAPGSGSVSRKSRKEEYTLPVQVEPVQLPNWIRESIPLNLATAHPLLQKAAVQGDAVAQYNLGLINFKSREWNAALSWFWKAAEKGHAGAQIYLSRMYIAGLGVEQNVKQGMFWLEKAVAQRDAQAQTDLGRMFIFGSGVANDCERAKFWVDKAVAQGYAEAQSYMGTMYSLGWCVDQDHRQSKFWFEKAAAQGNAEAQNSLGSIYAFGEGVIKDYKQAAFWYEKSALQGNYSAQYELGLLYYRGQGVTRNYRQAAIWFERAAEQGWPQSQFRIGLMYFLGEGVAQDYIEAHKWSNLAGRTEWSEPDRGTRGELARKLRGDVEKQMTREQIAEAQRRASEWIKARN